jgi:Domain of unknown function (DUF4864)
MRRLRRERMKALRQALAPLVAVALAALLVVALPARAAESPKVWPDASLRAAEWSSIRAAIGAQRKALIAGDGSKALSYASPAIRDQFGTPEIFLSMVRNAYAALLTARYTEFLDGAVIDGVVIQPLRLIAPDNTVQVALYTMQRQRDGRWKIAGCVLAPSSVQAA